MNMICKDGGTAGCGESIYGMGADLKLWGWVS